MFVDENQSTKDESSSSELIRSRVSSQVDKVRIICGGDIVHLGATRFVTNYIALESLLKKRVDWKKIFISDEWASHKLSWTTIGCEVKGLMFTHAYWDTISNLVSSMRHNIQFLALLIPKSSQ